jgi:hypothetical protein
MFTEHSEASRKETKGLAQQCCKILQRHVEVVGSLGTLSWGSQSNFASSKFDFEILMSLPEDNGNDLQCGETVAVKEWKLAQGSAGRD